ncbi:MAG: hypothetical protein U9O41_04620 [Candidatus Aerophobetes bacterium]|nr:hypothetical protein [Candidatus Aerophobetes bacterium]
MRKRGVLVALAVVFIFAGLVYADDISEQIITAKKLYEEGKYSQAVEELQFTIGQIQSLQVDQLKKALPEPLTGWKGEEAKGSIAPMGMLGGGGLSVSRYYYKEDSDESIHIEILGQSPLLQSIMMYFQNPAFLASEPNSKLVRVDGKKAVEKFSPQGKEGELSLILEGKTIVRVEGSNISKKDILYEYMKKVDFETIKKVTG